MILAAYQSYKKEAEHDLVGKIITAYNADAYYRNEVRDIFYQIQNASNFFEEGRFSVVEPDYETKNVSTIEELQNEIKSVLSEITQAINNTKEKDPDSDA